MVNFCSSLVAILNPPSRRDAVGWASHPRAHREPQTRAPAALCARFIYSRVHPQTAPPSSSPSFTVFHSFALLLSFSTERVHGSTRSLFFLTQIAHFLVLDRHESLSSHIQNARQQCRCAVCARSRRGGSGSCPVCLTQSYCRTRHTQTPQKPIVNRDD